MFSKIIISLFTLCISLVNFAQTGPGGIGNTTNNQVWLDANELSFVNNQSVQTISDISGNNNSFTQLNSTKQPLYKTAVVNGMPTLRFDGIDDDLLSSSISALESPEMTWFIVYKQDVAKTSCLLGANYASEVTKWYTYSLNSGFLRTAQWSNSTINHISYADDFSNFNFLSTHISPTNISAFKEGNLVNSINASYTTPVGHNFLVLGSFPSQSTNNKFFDGDIAEVIVYNSSLNDLERVIIENYLGAKYGKTIAEDYYTFQNTHKYGLIGIGNNGVDTHTSSKGYGVVTLNNPVSLSANEYMFIGHDGTDLSNLSTSNLPASLPLHARLSRTWKVDETGDAGVVTVTFDLSGQAGFAANGSYRLLVDTDTDFTNATVITGVENTPAQTVSFTLNLNSGDIFTLAGIESFPSAIHSILSGNWSSVNTWDCNCIPSNMDTVYIENGDVVNVDINAFVHNLNVTNTSSVVITNNINLSLYGDIDVNGNAVFSNGEIKFLGLSDQTFSAGGNSISLNRVELNNTNQSDINFTNGEYVLESTLYPTSGNMVINNGGTFIVNSTSSTTSGRIDVVAPSFSLNGAITVRRFLPSGPADIRTIASPVVGANLSEWDQDISISGTGFPDGCAYSSSGCYFSCKKFVGGDFASDYIDVTNPNESLTNGMGYELFIGDDLNTFSGATINSTGTIRDYQDYTLQYPTIKQGWNIVGNPYVSPIKFAEMPNNNMAKYFYVYDAQSGSYQWYDKVSNTASTPDLANGVIAIGQGFWVKVGGVPRVFFSQTLKTNSTATFIRRQDEMDASIYLTLTQQKTTYKNTVNIDFNEVAEDGTDTLDVDYFSVEGQESSSLYILTNTTKLAKNFLKDNNRDKVLDISIKILNTSYFTIEASNLENLDRYNNVTLIDKETGDVIDLKKENSYTFFSEVGEYERFKLILSNKKVDNVETLIYEDDLNNGELTITQLGNTINLESVEEIKGITEVSILNLLGQEVVYSKSMNIFTGDNMVFMPEGLSGMYLIVVKSSKGVQTKKIIL